MKVKPIKKKTVDAESKKVWVVEELHLDSDKKNNYFLARPFCLYEGKEISFATFVRKLRGIITEFLVAILSILIS